LLKFLGEELGAGQGGGVVFVELAVFELGVDLDGIQFFASRSNGIRSAEIA